MKLIFPVLGIAFGLYTALGIWFPRFRWHWKGTRIRCGQLSSAGFGLFFISVGAALLIGKSPPVWYFFPAMIGWILGVVGYALDARTHSRGAGQVSSAKAWIFVALGVFVLLVVAGIVAFHK